MKPKHGDLFVDDFSGVRFRWCDNRGDYIFESDFERRNNVNGNKHGNRRGEDLPGQPDNDCEPKGF